MSKQRVGLITFLKGSTNPKDWMPGCANYDHHYGGCIYAEKCKVESGQRCGYFERAVLPTAGDLGQSVEITAQYETRVQAVVNHAKLRNIDARACPDCGDPLPPRMRYCDTCRRRRKQKANRERAAMFRKSKRNALTQNSLDEMP